MSKSQDALTEETRRSHKAWFRWRDWLSGPFPEFADEYAEEMCRVAEGGKRETERSPHEIKREMEMISHIELAVGVVRALVGI